MTGPVLSVVGARPQFVKAAVVSRAIRERFSEVLVHTGQHYDEEMSGRFFSELGLAPPDVDLGVGSAPHGRQTARMRAGIRAEIERVRPSVVLTYGDTNSTLAASLAAAGAGVRLAHVEAGLRSFNARMPEEVNRIAADHLSDLCLGPTATAVRILESEGIGDRAVLVGDVMLDACLAARERAGPKALERRGVEAGEYAFATVHRAENTDDPSRLAGILDGLSRVGSPVVFAVHPRTRAAMERHGLTRPGNVIATAPLGYLDTISLVASAALVLTDSGGLQKEAYFLGTRCVTLRDETEWPETLAAGWNVLAGADPAAIAAAASSGPPSSPPDLSPFGDGRAAARIVEALVRE